MDKLQYKKERHHSLYHKNQCLSFVTYSLVCLCIDAFYTKKCIFHNWDHTLYKDCTVFYCQPIVIKKLIWR